jgi:hypothetical protein
VINCYSPPAVMIDTVQIRGECDHAAGTSDLTLDQIGTQFASSSSPRNFYPMEILSPWIKIAILEGTPKNVVTSERCHG